MTDHDWEQVVGILVKKMGGSAVITGLEEINFKGSLTISKPYNLDAILFTVVEP